MDLLIIGTAWALYFTAHSLFASLTIKRWVADRWPAFLPGYRLAFNGVASVLLVVPVWVTASYRGEAVWVWRGAWAVVADVATASAVLGFLWSLRYYDGSVFVGTRQWRERWSGTADPEALCVSPLHRFVRHPWYFLGLILIWTRDLDCASLLAAALITLYLLVGSWLEERKLLVQHGERYADYQRRVPALFPSPWRWLSREQAAAINAGLHRPLGTMGD